MNLYYNQPFEASQALYDKLRIRFKGIIAYRVENGKYYIKLWGIDYRKELEKFIENWNIENTKKLKI